MIWPAETSAPGVRAPSGRQRLRCRGSPRSDHGIPALLLLDSSVAPEHRRPTQIIRPRQATRAEAVFASDERRTIRDWRSRLGSPASRMPSGGVLVIYWEKSIPPEN